MVDVRLYEHCMMRHKKYWTAVSPRSGDNILVGFPESDNINELEKLGPDFKGDYALKKILPVEKMLYFCVHLGYKFKYVPSGN